MTGRLETELWFLGTQKCVTRVKPQALSDWYPYYQETFLELLSSKWALGGRTDTRVAQTTQAKLTQKGLK